MNLIYLPPNKIIIDGITIEFGEYRASIRKSLGSQYISENQTIKIGEATSDVICQRRDIYRLFNSVECLFFLGYDSNDLLSEIEIHNCESIKVNDFIFRFSDDLDDIALGLKKYSSVRKEGEGEYFFKEIKFSIINKKHMGGEGVTLGYFYCADDVAHLEN